MIYFQCVCFDNSCWWLGSSCWGVGLVDHDPLRVTSTPRVSSLGAIAMLFNSAAQSCTAVKHGRVCLMCAGCASSCVWCCELACGARLVSACTGQCLQKLLHHACKIKASSIDSSKHCNQTGNTTRNGQSKQLHSWPSASTAELWVTS